MENHLIVAQLNRIEKRLTALKDIFTTEELAEYTGFKRSYIYKLVHLNLIPYSKPNGKILFFDRKKVDQWLLSNSSKSIAEIEADATEFAMRKKR